MKQTTDEVTVDPRAAEGAVDIAEIGALPAAEGAVIIGEIEALGPDVVSTARCVRELLEARAQALEACRSALEEQSRRLTEERETLSRQEAELCEQFEAREASCADRERALEQTDEHWQQRMQEVTAARESLAALQVQLERELGKVAEQKGELLPQYGLTESGLAAGEPADRSVPAVSEAERQARESLERFQKLCRDAKRRAIGAG